MLGQKKRNPDVPAKQGGGDTAPLIPPVIPPLRTFVIRKQNFSWSEKFSVWVETDRDAADQPRTVEAHGLGVDDSRMLSFVVFYFLDGDPAKPTHSSKLFVNADEWSDVEEINAAFPTLEKH